MRRLGTVVVLVALASCAATVSTASAYTGTDPLSAPECFAAACTSGGTSITDLLNGGLSTATDGGGATIPYTTDNYAPTITHVLQDTEEIPAYRYVPALQDIVLATTAFAVGWKIGSTVNTKWLHLEGVGLGVIQTDPTTGLAPTGHWVYCAVNTNCNGFLPATGNYWQLKVNGNSNTYSDSCGSSSLAVDRAAGWWAHNVITAGIEVLDGTGTETCSGSSHTYSIWSRYIPAAAIASALVVDQPLQTYGSQPNSIQTGWPTPGGCGDTSNVCTYPGTQQQPQPCVYHTDGTTRTCGANPTGPYSLTGTDPGAWVNGQPVPSGSDPNGNLLRCKLDPTNFACPTMNGPKTDWADPGGAVTTYTMPSCVGLDPTVCEGMIGDAAGGAHQTPPAITTTTVDNGGANLTLPAGSVITQSVGAGTTVNPGAVTTVELTVNPDPLPVIVPTPGPWVLGDPYCSDVVAAGLVCTLIPLNVPDPLHGPNEVTRTVPEPGARLTPGDPVTVYVNPGLTPEGDPVPYPPNDPNDPGAPSQNPNPTPQPGGTGDGCSCPPLNFSPLSSLALGNKFPFGVFAYAAGVIDSFNVQPAAPDFAINVAATGGTKGQASPGTYDVNLGDPVHMGWLDTYMGYWRDLITFALWVGAIWFVGTRLLGFNGSGDPGAGTDEVM